MKNTPGKNNDSNYKIKMITSKDEIPFDLLLLADETIDAIEKYIYKCDVYVALIDKQLQPVAVFALCRVDKTTIEIKNIAVVEPYQNKGLGSQLLNEIKNIAREENLNTIIVGTPEAGFKEIKFYEQNGFRKFEIKKDFFLLNYAEPIIENGIRLRDMLMLKCDLGK